LRLTGHFCLALSIGGVLNLANAVSKLFSKKIHPVQRNALAADFGSVSRLSDLLLASYHPFQKQKI